VGVGPGSGGGRSGCDGATGQTAPRTTLTAARFERPAGRQAAAPSGAAAPPDERRRAAGRTPRALPRGGLPTWSIPGVSKRTKKVRTRALILVRRYPESQEIGPVAVFRHPVFLVKIFTKHARKGQPNSYRLATVRPDHRALPRAQHVAQLRTRTSYGRRSEQQKEGIAAQER